MNKLCFLLGVFLVLSVSFVSALNVSSNVFFDGGVNASYSFNDSNNLSSVIVNNSFLVVESVDVNWTIFKSPSVATNYTIFRLDVVSREVGTNLSVDNYTLFDQYNALFGDNIVFVAGDDYVWNWTNSQDYFNFTNKSFTVNQSGFFVIGDVHAREWSFYDVDNNALGSLSGVVCVQDNITYSGDYYFPKSTGSVLCSLDNYVDLLISSFGDYPESSSKGLTFSLFVEDDSTDGGSSTVFNSLSIVDLLGDDDSSVSSCDTFVSPNYLVIDDGLSVNFSVFNNGSYDQDYVFDLDFADKVSFIVSGADVVSSKSVEDYVLTINTLSKELVDSGSLVVSLDGCNDITVPLVISFENRDVIPSDYVVFGKNFLFADFPGTSIPFIYLYLVLVLVVGSLVLITFKSDTFLEYFIVWFVILFVPLFLLLFLRWLI